MRRPPSGRALKKVEVVDARRCGGAYVLDALFARLGITAALRKAAQGRRLDAELVERVCFALVAQRALEPGSKLAATRWARDRVALPGCPAFSDDAASLQRLRGRRDGRLNVCASGSP